MNSIIREHFIKTSAELVIFVSVHKQKRDNTKGEEMDCRRNTKEPYIISDDYLAQMY